VGRGFGPSAADCDFRRFLEKFQIGPELLSWFAVTSAFTGYPRLQNVGDITWQDFFQRGANHVEKAIATRIQFISVGSRSS
jgi:hypothetical protein